MRKLLSPLLECDKICIEKIKLNLKSRDDIPVVLIGLQHLYSQKDVRNELLMLLDKKMLVGVNKNVGRPGMPLWNILVMGVVKQGLGCDFDRLHELANEHKTLRKFLGHIVSDEYEYNYQTLIDNVNLLTPELLGEINQVVVNIGHEIAGKEPGETLRARCDSFVVETNVHYPTDVNLLWDAIRCLLRSTGKTALKYKMPGFRQSTHLQGSIKNKFNKIRKTRRANSRHVKKYLKVCTELVGRSEALVEKLEAKGAFPKEINEIRYFSLHAVRQIDQINQRLLKGETIPHNKKVFSIFEPHTRWISKGKAGCAVELGVPVCIIESQFQFILHHEVMWKGSDVDFAISMVKITKEMFPDFCAVSFDRGFHSPANRACLDQILDDNVMPRKGRLSKAEQDREQGETFVVMRRQHPAVESAINNLEHRGLDRVRSKGPDGFARTVALSVVALNVHRIGRLLRQQAREKYRLTA